jgi:hypothetical protein
MRNLRNHPTTHHRVLPLVQEFKVQIPLGRILTRTRAGRLFQSYHRPHGNGGPTWILKKLTGPFVTLVVQENGIGGALVVKTAVQSARLVEA